jgi:murein DD-endopeptidase MepM/ murein hydrolase activator NlpD
MMAEEKRKNKKYIHKLLYKYRLVILNDNTFEEIGYIRLTRLNIISLTGTFLILLIALTYTTIAYTPIRESIPGYPDTEMRNNIIQNALRLDSLDKELKFRDQYFGNLSQIISGGVPNDFMGQSADTGTNISNIQFTRSASDSLLRSEIEFSDKIGISSNPEKKESIKLERIYFFTPVKGLVTNSFNPLTNHFGTDIVAAPNEVVKAILDGTVIMAAWTIETGNVIQIQHEKNLISIYKHNAELLKKIGDRIKAGDAIAIVGNSGELTTGPHLHFELWQNGIALNPEEYIIF